MSTRRPPNQHPGARRPRYRELLDKRHRPSSKVSSLEAAQLPQLQRSQWSLGSGADGLAASGGPRMAAALPESQELLEREEGRTKAGKHPERRSAGIHGPSNLVLLVSVVAVLNVIGLVMVLSASSVDALQQYGSAWVFFKHQVVWLALGTAVLLASQRLDYRRWRRLSLPIMALTILLLFAVLLPHIGVHVSGSSRWLGFGQLTIQPSELMKVAMILFVASVLARRADDYQWKDVLRPIGVVFALAALLIMKQPDMGTAIVLACTVLAMLFVVGTPRRFMAALVLGVVVVGGVFALAEPYRRARILSFLHPFAHASGSGYQVVQSLVGLGRGHLVGVGLGASRAKWGFLPNAHTDFIFSIIGEELGLLGSLLVVGLFAALALLGIRVAARAPDRLGALLAIGVTCWITSQAVINVGAAIGILPVTGVPLPFVSYGGSSLVLLMGGAGILMNVASQERRSPATAERT